MLEMMLKKNGCAICLSCFLETNLIPFQQIAWKEECMSLRSGKRVHPLTPNGPGKGMDQNYYRLLPSIRMGHNLTKLW